MTGRLHLPPFTVLFLLFLLLLLPSGEPRCQNPVIFVFGDSNSDTGGLRAGVGLSEEIPPYGRLFFHKFTGRFCDGRLVIDFLCGSINTSYLSPYLESLGSDFSNGANFAIAAASTLPPSVPFSLAIQVHQFLRFKSRVREPSIPGGKPVINDEGFETGLYLFDIGQNDLNAAFASSLTYTQLIEKIQAVLAEIKSAIEAIYRSGGKNFWIHGTGPLGCLPQKLSSFAKNGLDLDLHGCLQSINDAAKALNNGIFDLCQQLRTELKNATIVYVDIYSIKYELIANFTKYGFENPLMACCGYGGPPYNYNSSIPCGHVGHQVCKEGSKYVSWDGVHYSEAANTIIASKILSTLYSQPKLKFDYFCHA